MYIDVWIRVRIGNTEYLLRIFFCFPFCLLAFSFFCFVIFSLSTTQLSFYGGVGGFPHPLHVALPGLCLDSFLFTPLSQVGHQASLLYIGNHVAYQVCRYEDNSALPRAWSHGTSQTDLSLLVSMVPRHLDNSGAQTWYSESAALSLCGPRSALRKRKNGSHSASLRIYFQ